MNIAIDLGAVAKWLLPILLGWGISAEVRLRTIQETARIETAETTAALHTIVAALTVEKRPETPK